MLQRFAVSQLLDPQSLRSLQEIALHAEPGQETLNMSEIFRALTDSIWTELPAAEADVKKDRRSWPFPSIRRNLQREHVGELCKLVLGPKRTCPASTRSCSATTRPSSPADARALARLHLDEINERIKAGLAQEPDDMTKAHLSELRAEIRKTLDASLQVNEP